MLFKGTNGFRANALAQKIQDVGGYHQRYTSFDRTVFWIDVPKDGPASRSNPGRCDDDSTLPAEEYAKEQEVIRPSSRWADDPIGWRANSFSRPHSRASVPAPGHWAHRRLQTQLTRDQVLEYYQARYVPNNLTFVVVGDVEAEKVIAARRPLQRLSGKIAPTLFIPSEPPQLGRRVVHQDFVTELTRLSLAWHIPEITPSRRAGVGSSVDYFGRRPQLASLPAVREEAGVPMASPRFLTRPAIPDCSGSMPR